MAVIRPNDSEGGSAGPHRSRPRQAVPQPVCSATAVAPLCLTKSCAAGRCSHMSDTLIVGPVRTVAGLGGAGVPFYVIPFEKRGVCVGPQSRDMLTEEARQATDIFVFSHGWNNVW